MIGVMPGAPVIDTTFDVRSDAGGKDPDSHSKTLRRYHQLLWSKPLRRGEAFELDAKLACSSGQGGFSLASDSIGHTYSAWSRPPRLVSAVRAVAPELACTVGAFIVFPLPVRVDGKWRQSINQARGIHHKIRDRFDDLGVHSSALFHGNEPAVTGA